MKLEGFNKLKFGGKLAQSGSGKVGKTSSGPTHPANGHKMGLFFWSVLLLIGLGLAGTLVFGKKGLYHLYKLSQERDRLLQTNQTVKAENNRLWKTIERLQHDQEMIEDMIRSELHYIKPDERIYHLNPELRALPQVTPPTPRPQPIAKSTKPKSGKTTKPKP
ncbi:MAG: septum formation initiator family protein [Desulfobacca sp.]|nr:septum formation initiator family protein [Desulfobacca sp.]